MTIKTLQQALSNPKRRRRAPLGGLGAGRRLRACWRRWASRPGLWRGFLEMEGVLLEMDVDVDGLGVLGALFAVHGLV